MTAKQFKIRYLSLITLTWFTPPAMLLAMLLLTNLAEASQITQRLSSALPLTFHFLALIVIMWYFNRHAAPLYDFLQPSEPENPAPGLTMTTQITTHFSQHYWGIFLSYTVISTIVLITGAKYPTAVVVTASDWLQICLATVILAVLAELPLFVLLLGLIHKVTGHTSPQKNRLAPPFQAAYQQDTNGANPTSSTNNLSELITHQHKLLTGLRLQQSQLIHQMTYRTNELLKSNQEFEAFAYALSHDLRTPLCAIKGFSEILLDDYGSKLDANGKDFLNIVCRKTNDMSQLIDGLSSLSNATYQPLTSKTVDLSLLAMEAAAALKDIQPARSAQFLFTDNLTAVCDERLIKVALGNLFDNAWKYSLNDVNSIIEFGYSKPQHAFYVKDNGIGFDIKHASKLFKPFHRLHSSDEFPGSGIGLATVQRIINRHNGKIWAESTLSKGSTFYFNLYP